MSLTLNAYGLPQRDGMVLKLPPKEQAALALLLRESPRLVSKEELVQHVWGGARFPTPV